MYWFGPRNGLVHRLKPYDDHQRSNSSLYVPFGAMTLLLLLIPHNYMGLPQQLLSHSSRGQLEGGSQTLPGRLGGRSDTQLAALPNELLYTPCRDLPPAQSNVCPTSHQQNCSRQQPARSPHRSANLTPVIYIWELLYGSRGSNVAKMVTTLSHP